MMLETGVGYIQEELQRLQVRVSYLYDEVWHDKVAARVEEAELQVIMTETESFCSDASTAVTVLNERVERLCRLADKYS